jgi:hypothetical protein
VGAAGLVAWGGPSKSSTGWISADGQVWTARPPSPDRDFIPQASDGRQIIGDSYVEGGQDLFAVSTDGLSWQTLADTGATDQMPRWPGMGSPTADAVFRFPRAVGMVGQNGTASFPLWLADAVTAP